MPRRSLAVFAFVAAAGCATAPPEPTHRDFTGVWSGPITTPNDPRWRAEDFLCFAGCPQILAEAVTAWLDDPANQDRPIAEMGAEIGPAALLRFTSLLTPEGARLLQENTIENDPALQCQPDDLARDALNPTPMIIREEPGALAIEYEKWRHVRTVYMDGRGHPDAIEPTLLGHSIGWYEGDALLIETVGVEAYPYQLSTMGAHSDEATFLERYEMDDSAQRLTLTITVTDPVTLTEPLAFIKTWIATPDVTLLPYDCDDVAGVP